MILKFGVLTNEGLILEQMMQPKISRLLLIMAAVIVSFVFVKRYHNIHSIFYGDAMGYYMYLPAATIYHNLDRINKLPEDRGIPEGPIAYADGMWYEMTRLPDSGVINQYTYGVALMEAPFFFAAHAYEKATGGPANGYSALYERAIKVSSFVYALLGLIIVYAVLRRYFNELHSVLTVLLLFIGTNIFWFVLYQGGMAHLPLFFLYALLMWLTVRVHEKASLWLFVALGLTAGVITIIRPSDIICLLLPLLFGVYNGATLRSKWQFIVSNFPKIILLAIVFALPIIPQLLYWKMLTGSYLVYSYGDQVFHWRDPKIIQGLFHFNNGWLVYTPLMIFSVIGLFCYRRIRQWIVPVVLVVLLYIYIIYSWYLPNYINGLGSRPMIHMYPLLALPLAAFISFVARKGVAAKALVFVLMLFFISLNISYSIQQASGVLISEESNAAFNYRMLYRTNLTYNDLVTYDIGEIQPDERKLTRIRTIKCERYDDSLSDHFIADTGRGSRYVYHIWGKDPYQPYGINTTYRKTEFGDARWFKCSGKFLYTEGAGYRKHLFYIAINRGDSNISWKGVKIENKIGNGEDGPMRLDHQKTWEWGYVTFFSRIPEDIREGDRISLDVWNHAQQQLFLDNICLELYK
jgi:hypothetical protein